MVVSLSVGEEIFLTLDEALSACIPAIGEGNRPARRTHRPWMLSRAGN